MVKEKRSTAIVFAGSRRTWPSCQIIGPNLLRAYQEAPAFRNAVYHPLSPRAKASDVWKCAANIFAQRPDRLVITETLSSQELLLRSLELFYSGTPLPPVSVHVYGDFTWYPERWLALRKFAGLRIRLICASERQARLISQFVKDSSIVSVCPFPIDTEIFKYSLKERTRVRNELGLGDDFVALYVGRLSLQKNIVSLLEQMAAVIRESPRPTRFLLAGDFDDHGAPLFGVSKRKGDYEASIRRCLSSLPTSIRKRITWIGELANRDLAAIYNASDLFVSLSTHHDEFFGMAVAEALCTGVPCVMTDWGGYGSFGKGRDLAQVPVEIGDTGLNIKTDIFRDLVLKQIISPVSPAGRRRLSKDHQDRFAFKSVSRVLERLHTPTPTRFSGFDPLLRRLVTSATRGCHFPRGPVKKSLYEDVFGVYAHPESRTDGSL